MPSKTKTKPRARPYREGGQLLRTIRKRRGLSLHDVVESINKEYGKKVFHSERDLVRAESGEGRVWPRDALIANQRPGIRRRARPLAGLLLLD